MTSVSVNQTLQAAHNTNRSISSPGMTAIQVTALTVFSGGISLIGTVSNVLLIFAVVLNRQLRQTSTAILLINLSFSDFLICTLYVPMYIYGINFSSSAAFEVARYRMGFGLFFGSLNNEFSVTLDRFISICFPYRYINWMTKTATVSMIAASWFLAIALTLLSLLSSTPVFSLVYIAVLKMFIIIFHVAMFCVARRAARRIASQYHCGRRDFPVWNKSTKVVSMVVTASLLCWLPIVLLPVTVSPSSPSFGRYMKVALAFTSLSAAIDPFIFCWRLKDFRVALCSCLYKPRGASNSVYPMRELITNYSIEKSSAPHGSTVQ